MDSETRVDSYTMPLDAELAKAYLESHEIPVRLEGEAIVGSAFALGPMLGGIRLFVDKRDEARASALLAEYHRALREKGDQASSSDAEPDGDALEDPRKETPEGLVTRAWATSLVALIVFPVAMHIYSSKLLLGIKPSELTGKARRRYFVAWAVNITVIVGAAYLVWTLTQS